MTKVNLKFNGNNFSYSYDSKDGSGYGCINEIINRNEYGLDRFSNLKNKVIIDIGANHGLATIILAKQNPESTIYCFEPNPRLYDIILSNIKDNNLTNVKPYNKAVNTNKSLFLIENSETSGASTLGYDKNQMQNFYKNSLVKQIEIECVSIDEFLNEENIKNIFLLKIDCEGSEFDILTKSKLLFDKVEIENMVGEFHDLSYYYDREMFSTDLLEMCRKNIKGIVNVSILKL